MGALKSDASKSWSMFWPSMVVAFIAHIVVYSVQVLVLFGLRGYLMRLNVLKRRAADAREVNVSASARC